MRTKGTPQVVYGLYDTKNNEVCIGILSYAEIAQRFNTCVGSIWSMISRGQLLEGRYKAVKFNVKDLDN